MNIVQSGQHKIYQHGRGRFFALRVAPAFTLIELLVVLAIIGVLAGLAAPRWAEARERARVAQVLVELRQIEVALRLYYEDHGRYPPVRVSCNTLERDHWCQLPPELVQGRYLPGAGTKGVSSAMLDPFNPGHTYKYAAIGPYLLNGAPQPENFAMFVPDDFPTCRSKIGSWREDAEAPLAWAVWSLGPRAHRDRALNSRAPLSAATWYTGTGEHGVIANIQTREGFSFTTL